MILYVDDIVIAYNDLSVVANTKRFLSQHFQMKDLGDVRYVLGIKVERNRVVGYLSLSQESYVDNVLKRFNMSNCASTEAPIVNGDKLRKSQCPKTNLERNEMQGVPYASAVGCIQYLQVCTRLDISFTTGMLGRFQSNPGRVHWGAVKKAMRHLKKTQDFKLFFRKSSNIKVVGYSDSDFADVSRSSHQGFTAFSV